MSEFEIVVLTLSLVLGLGVAQILSATVAAIRQRESSRIHWLPLMWAGLIFLFHVGFFFSLMDMDATGIIWSWDRYGPVLLWVVLIFLAGGLVLPAQGGQRAPQLLDDFDRHGRLALVPLALALLISIPMNVQAGGAWLSLANLCNVLLIAFAAMVFSVERRLWRVTLTLIFGALQIIAMLFVWSNPGMRAPFR